MKLSPKKLFIILVLNLSFLSHYSMAQDGSRNSRYGTITANPVTGALRILPPMESRSDNPRIDLSSPEQRLKEGRKIFMHLESQREEWRKLHQAEELLRSHPKAQQLPSIPKLPKAKLFGRETPFYESPGGLRNSRTIMNESPSTVNVLINGKQSDTITAGSGFTISASFAPNSISAIISTFIDLNANGVIDSSDAPLLSEGLMLDNGEDDSDPAVGTIVTKVTESSVYASICGNVLFRVDNFQSVSVARLFVIQKPSTKVVIGKIVPVMKDIIFGFYSYEPENSFFRFIFPDSTGTVILQFDTTANTELNISVISLSSIPAGMLPPADTLVYIVNDTTRITQRFLTATEFIEGYVKDQHGDPARNVLVYAYTTCSGDCEYNRQITGMTDANGYYKLSSRTGGWRVGISLTQYASDYIEPGQLSSTITVASGQTARYDFFLLRSNATITGSVKHNTAGIGGFPVTASNDSLYMDALTDQNGNYALKVYKPLTGSYYYSVRPNFYDHSYYVEPQVQNNILVGATNVNFLLFVVTGGFHGRVVDEMTGAGIANANISFSGNYYRSVTSDDSGFFKVKLRPGTYSLYISAPYYLTISRSGIAIGSTVSTDIFTMKRMGSISGVVSGDGGKAVANAFVSVRDTSGNYVGSQYTDSKGMFTISGLQTGKYKAVANRTGYLLQWYNNKSSLAAADPISVTYGLDTPNINFSLSLGGSISGIVKNKSGAPVPNAYLEAVDSTHAIISTATTGDSGKYRITGLITGKYYVTVQSSDYVTQWYNGAQDYVTATKIPVVVNVNTPNIDFTLTTGGIIAGTVKDKLGNPVVNAAVEAFDSNYYYIQYTYTNASGSYELKKLPNGKKLFISAYQSLYTRRYYDNTSDRNLATPIVLQPEERKDNINFTLVLAGKITGTVKSKLGSPLNGISLYASSSTGYSFYSNTNIFGEYTMTGVPAGRYIVSAFGGTYLEQWYNQKSSRQFADSITVLDEQTVPNIDFTLAKASSILGTVKSTDGDPLQYTSMYLAQKNGPDFYSVSDFSGAYVFPNLSPGKYSVSAERIGYNRQWYNHRSSMLLADSITVPSETIIPNINFDLEPIKSDSVIVKVVVNNLPNALKFSQTHVGDNEIDYWWGIRFELQSDSLSTSDDFETELALFHTKFPNETAYNADPITATQHALVRWNKNSGEIMRTNVRAWKNPLEKNTLYFAAPREWTELSQIGSSVKFFARTMYDSPEGRIADTTEIGTGTVMVQDAAGDVAFGATDIVSTGWNITLSAPEIVRPIPTTFSLEQNYPNPFNPSTTIRYALPSTAHVRLSVFDLLGREIATLADEEQSAGWKEIKWNPSKTASGIYLYKIQAGSFVETKRMMLLK